MKKIITIKNGEQELVYSCSIANGLFNARCITDENKTCSIKLYGCDNSLDKLVCEFIESLRMVHSDINDDLEIYVERLR